MKSALWLSCAFAALALAACGGPNSSGGGAASNGGGGPKAAPTGNAPAEQVAKEQRGNVKCPAEVAARPANTPVNDVVGVRPGLTYEEAVNVVLCDSPLLVTAAATDRGFQLQTYGQTVRQGFNARFAEARVEKSSKQIMQEMQDDAIARSGNAVREDMKPGQVKYYVGTMGMPGQEKVITAAREEWFAEGKQPTVASVADALVAKYGTPTERQMTNGGQAYLRWAYDPSGAPISAANNSNRCYGVDSPDGGANVSPECGLVVQARVSPTEINSGIAKMIQVGVVDQAGGYAALNAAEAALKAQDDARKAKELNDATKNGAAPKL